MKKINIKFLFFDDKTCDRCKTTKNTLAGAVKDFKKLHRKGVEIILKKQKLTKKEIESSPTILLDGIDLQSYLSSIPMPQSSHCNACSCLIGQSVSCRSYGNDNLAKEQILAALEKHLIGG